MGIEIERKFLVSSDGWRTAAHRVIPMAQGYINDMGALDRGTQNASVRVRIEGDHAALNLKSRTLGHTRQEFDYPIPVEDARALLALCVGGLIDKRRHLVEHAGLTSKWMSSSVTTPAWWWLKSSWKAPTKPSTCRTGSVPK